MLYARTYYIHTFTEGRSKSSLHPLIRDVFPIIRTGKTQEVGVQTSLPELGGLHFKLRYSVGKSWNVLYTPSTYHHTNGCM